MNRFSLFASLIALGMGTASVLHANRQPNSASGASESVSQMNDGAFRDGLYLGKLAAERGLAPHVARGRWSTEADRSSFSAGYQRGYKEARGQASHPANAGAAVIVGVATVVGANPGPKPISMSADPSCAKQHTKTVLAQDVVADAKGRLQNVVVFVSDGLGGRAFDPPKTPAVISQKGCQYEPHVVAVQANQRLEVVNDDPTSHNIHPTPANNREWNKAELPGAKVEETFAREEIAIPVKCNIHPWMRGYIAVFKHPYFMVTKEDGSFVLPNLPPGTYTIKAWHEKLGTASQTVTIGADEIKEISFVFKSI
jgi:plastocyanin